MFKTGDIVRVLPTPDGSPLYGEALGNQRGTPRLSVGGCFLVVAEDGEERIVLGCRHGWVGVRADAVELVPRPESQDVTPPAPQPATQPAPGGSGQGESMIRIYGASDDLVEIEGHPDGDEIGCYYEDVVITVHDADDPKGGGVAVRMSYAPRFGDAAGFACWSAEIVQLGEGLVIPWPIRIRHDVRRVDDVGYSVVVEIDAPQSVTLKASTVSR